MQVGAAPALALPGGCRAPALGPGVGFAFTSLLWGLAGLGARRGFRRSAPWGLCLEELHMRTQVAEGMGEAVWCGQLPWEDAALSDGGEKWLFCVRIPNKGKGRTGMEAAVMPESSPELLQPTVNSASLSIS